MIEVNLQLDSPAPPRSPIGDFAFAMLDLLPFSPSLFPFHGIIIAPYHRILRGGNLAIHGGEEAAPFLGLKNIGYLL